MELFKLAMIVCATALLGVACNNAASTNQPAPNNTPRTANANTTTPAPTPADQLADARKMFSTGGVCARCHGEQGEGGEFELDGKKLKAPSLRAGHALSHSDAQLAKKITSGGDGMPAFGKRLSQDQINNLVRFIRQDLQAGASGAANNNRAAEGSK